MAIVFELVVNFGADAIAAAAARRLVTLAPPVAVGGHTIGPGSSLAVVVPVAMGPGASGEVGRHLREAIRKVNTGEFADAVTTARKAIDVLDTAAGQRPSDRTITQTPSIQRPPDLRRHLLRHAVFSLASAGAHGDPVASAFVWTRGSALSVVAAVAALAAVEQPPDPVP